MTTPLPHELVEHVASGNCVLFLGAGATRDSGGPVGDELAKLLAVHFSKTDIPTDDLQRFTDILTALPDVDREDVDKHIIEILRDCAPAIGHRLLPFFHWRAIFTTNYDRLVELAYDIATTEVPRKPLQTAKVMLRAQDHALLTDRTHVALHKLHGCIAHVEKSVPLVLTTADFLRSRKTRIKMLRSLRSLAEAHTCLFVGYSFTDGVVTSMLSEMEEASPYHSRRRMYVALPSFSDTARAFFESQRFTCVTASFSELMSAFESTIDAEARKACQQRRLAPIVNPQGDPLPLPNQLRLSLASQIELLKHETYSSPDARRFLSGLPPTVADLKSNADVERAASVQLSETIRNVIADPGFVVPLIVVLGPGGAGKTTVALRVAYNLAAEGAVIACRLLNHEMINRSEIVEFARRIGQPILFVIDGIELKGCWRLVRELRAELTAARCRAVLLGSCQKATWNTLKQQTPQPQSREFDFSDPLSPSEADGLLDRLERAQLIDPASKRERRQQLTNILVACEGHLIVALLELVKARPFQDIILHEYELLSLRAREAYQYVSLLHQHGLSIPDYVLNAVTVRDWKVFTAEVIRQESELIIVQDLNYPTGRICFRTRHRRIARLIVENTIPKTEDRTRMYGKVVGNLGTTLEDRSYLIGLLTSDGVQKDLQSDKAVRELFEKGLDLFPEDRTLILHLAKYWMSRGELVKARGLLEWGRSLDHSDTYILHELGVCTAREAKLMPDSSVRDGTYAEAERLFRLKQLRDPTSHYGYRSEARMHIFRAAEHNEFDDRRMELLSAAADAIQRGMDLVGEEGQGVLAETQAELSSALGDPARTIALISEVVSRRQIRYSSTYHLLANAYLAIADLEHALQAVEDGLASFPGDSRLCAMLLHQLEARHFRSEDRARCREVISSIPDDDPLRPKALFLRGVLDFYDGYYPNVRRVFSQLREALGRRASTKIRIRLSDSSGLPDLRRGVAKRGHAAQLFVVDSQTGYQFPLDNPTLLDGLPLPAEVAFHLGFSLAGPRAVVNSGGS